MTDRRDFLKTSVLAAGATAAMTMDAKSYDEFAPFYDLCYADRRAEIAFYTSLLRPQDRRVLELGCALPARRGAGAAGGTPAGAARPRHGAGRGGLAHTVFRSHPDRRPRPAHQHSQIPPCCATFTTCFWDARARMATPSSFAANPITV